MRISNNKNVQKYPYFLKGEQLKSVQFEKYLGIFITSNLKWNKQVNYVYQHASRKLGMLKRVFSNCDTETKESLFNQLIRSKLEYACPAWDPHTIIEQRKL